MFERGLNCPWGLRVDDYVTTLTLRQFQQEMAVALVVGNGTNDTTISTIAL